MKLLHLLKWSLAARIMVSCIQTKLSHSYTLFKSCCTQYLRLWIQHKFHSWNAGVGKFMCSVWSLLWFADAFLPEKVPFVIRATRSFLLLVCLKWDYELFQLEQLNGNPLHCYVSLYPLKVFYTYKYTWILVCTYCINNCLLLCKSMPVWVECTECKDVHFNKWLCLHE